MTTNSSPNAFIGSAQAPTAAELSAALGQTGRGLWDELVAAMATQHGLTEQEWTSYSPKAGWSMRFKQRKRNIVYMSPLADGSFLATLILGQKAMTAAREAKFPKAITKILDEAPKYPEGFGLRIPVGSSRDVSNVVRLAGIKIAH
jgi:hypothetical protein